MWIIKMKHIGKCVNTRQKQLFQKRLMIKQCTLNGTTVGSYVCLEDEEKHDQQNQVAFTFFLSLLGYGVG